MQGEFYAVFDNSMALGHLDDRFRFRRVCLASFFRAQAPGGRWLDGPHVDCKLPVKLLLAMIWRASVSSVQGPPQPLDRALGAGIAVRRWAPLLLPLLPPLPPSLPEPADAADAATAAITAAAACMPARYMQQRQHGAIFSPTPQALPTCQKTTPSCCCMRCALGVHMNAQQAAQRGCLHSAVYGVGNAQGSCDSALKSCCLPFEDA